VDSAYVRVIQRGNRTGLTLKSGEPFRVSRKFLRQ
jgi:hypothetical protein